LEGLNSFLAQIAWRVVLKRMCVKKWPLAGLKDFKRR